MNKHWLTASLALASAGVGSCKPRNDSAKILSADSSTSLSGDAGAFVQTCSQSQQFVMLENGNGGLGDGTDQSGMALTGKNGKGGGFSLADANTSPKGQAAFDAFTRSCAATCHTRTTTSGRLGDVLNYTVALRLKDRIKQRIQAREMPPTTAPVRLSDADAAAVLAWVDDPQPFPGQGGIPPLDANGGITGYRDDDTALDDSFGFINGEAQLACIKADFSRVASIDKPFVRYVTFTHLYNAGVRKKDWAIRKKAFYKALNSVSRSQEIRSTGAIAIDTTTMTIFRIDLRAYKITPDLWDAAKLTNTQAAQNVYPYGLGQGFTDKGRLGTGSEADLAALYPIRGDYLLREFLQRDKYYGMIGVTGIRTADEFYAKRLGAGGADFSMADLRNTFDAKRAVFSDSEVNRGGYRVAEKIEATGAIAWNLFDFDKSLASADPHKDPTIAPLGPCFTGARAPFQECGATPGRWIFANDATETSFQLPNGLFAYAAFDKDGKLSAENKVTVDPTNQEHKNVVGLSCIECHAVGLMPFHDAVGNQARRDLVTKVKNKQYGEVTQVVDRIHPDPKDFNAYVNVANSRYYAALTAVGIQAGEIQPEPISLLVGDYEKPLTRRLAAAEVGLSEDDLVAAINGSDRLRTLLSVFLNNQTLARDQFQDKFSAIVADLNGQASAPGGPLAPTLACVDAGGGKFRPKFGDNDIGSPGTNWDQPTCSQAIAAQRFNFVCTPCDAGSGNFGFRIWNLANATGTDGCTSLSQQVCLLSTPKAKVSGVCFPTVSDAGLRWSVFKAAGGSDGNFDSVDTCSATLQ